MASLLMALFDGLVLQWLLDPDAIPSGDELIDSLIETVGVALELDERQRSVRRRTKRATRG